MYIRTHVRPVRALSAVLVAGAFAAATFQPPGTAAAAPENAALVRMPTSAAPHATTWRALQFNFCGSSRHDLCGAEGRGDKFVGGLRNHIVAFRPHVVTLQEMCRSQFAQLRRRLEGDWTMRGTFLTTHRDPDELTCKHNRFGLAVLTRRDWSNRSVDCLDSCNRGKTQVAHRARLCVGTTLKIRTRVCSVHIGTSGQPGQIADLMPELNRSAAVMPVLIGGDFNVEPAYDALDRVYSSGGWGHFGRFQEADQCTFRYVSSPTCNETTRLTRKIDFVFMAARWFKGVTGDATWARFSDHDPLRAWFKQCARRVC